MIGATFVAGSHAQAQDNPARDNEDARLGTITVVGQGFDENAVGQEFDENAKDVPASVEIFTQDEIEKQNIISTMDIIRKTPNLSIHAGPNGVAAKIAIRGIGPQFSFIDSSVPVYVDGVMVPAGQALATLKNVERVEVLRGPQNTQLGQNSIAGAINIETRLPSSQAEVSLGSGFGNRGHRQADAHFSGPLIGDAVFGSLTLSGTDGDGFVRNLATDDNADEYDSQYMQSKLRILPADGVELRFNFDISDRDGPARFWTNRADNTINTTDDVRNETESVGGSAVLIYELENAEFRSTSSLRRTEIDSLFPSPYAIESKEEIFSQELRLTSRHKSSPFSWLAGLYYMDEKKDMVIDFATFFSKWDTDLKTDQYAAFGEVGYDLTDRWNVSAGARYTHVERSATPLVTIFGAKTLLDYDESYDGFTPNISTTIKLTPDTNLYGTIAAGFKLGTINFGVFNFNHLKVESEKSINYEVGLKGNLRENRIAYGMSVFYMTLDDYQAYESAFV